MPGGAKNLPWKRFGVPANEDDNNSATEVLLFQDGGGSPTQVQHDGCPIHGSWSEEHGVAETTRLCMKEPLHSLDVHSFDFFLYIPK